jgi:phosphoglycolate phosphatase
MPVRAVLFDLDGTLIDTLSDIAAGTNQALRELGLEQHPQSAYRSFVGSGIRVLAERALGEHATEKRIEHLIETAGSVMAENHRATVYPGIGELLSVLRGRFLLGVLSNKPHAILQETVDRFFGEMDFREIEGQRDGVPEKPDPTIARQIVGRLGVSAAEVVYVGDSDVDMETAINAGFVGVGASWGFRGRKELENAGAAFVIDEPGELLPILGISKE